MIEICKADPSHVQGIAKVFSDGYRATYGETHSKEYIERIISEFYNTDRIVDEVTKTSRYWGGYFVALDNNEVVGAGGGGMINDTAGELFVLYLDPNRRNEGIGTMLLEAVTKQQKEEYNASEQWVSVQKGNEKGIPFYEARGFIFQHEQNGYGNADGEDYISLRYCRQL
ncbi:ribosomal protein S18 acetylase RimI-like enzyme [Neobacillus niacini]|jgi:ribosomal protein S18 acetylase RimI-like enzyme|uniref:GNAT family N-acetyltransferase n=1 Tax=Neobacillus driksii TaxID=3035913 RepID=UPI002784C9C0|nr:GNAT family N-acetyltransferase [Neobacillus niacini]MDQ0973745.1 ribosomal protein S18 acetylase RimI-like enzyme [Neobacillus niacini]